MGVKISREKRSFSPKIFQNSNSAVTAEYENGVIGYIKYIWGDVVFVVMFLPISHLIGL